VRLAHVSDIHVSARLRSWRGEDWFNKRMAAWLNLRLLGRGLRFRHAARVLAALDAELTRRPVDHVLFSGDATALGFDEEFARAAELLGVGRRPGLAVPGNHDYCTDRARRCGAFEHHFATWLTGRRIDDSVYPFAQRVGPVWLVGVNSAVPNRLAWDASGAVGAGQLERLRALLARLEPGPRVLVTHYPVRLASGRPEKRTHRLRDLDALVAVARQGGVSLWLHGHRHDAYQHGPDDAVPFPVVCAGSATQIGLWSYGEYTLRGTRLHAVRRAYDPDADRFHDAAEFEVEARPLAGAAATRPSP
jgi:3',5'-cyclic AMP phosphodiesterase CpdA